MNDTQEINFVQKLEQLSQIQQPVQIRVPKEKWKSKLGLTKIFGTHYDAGYIEVRKNEDGKTFKVEYTNYGYMQTRMSSNDWKRADFQANGSRNLNDLLPALWSGAAFQAGIPVSAAPGKFRDNVFSTIESHVNRAYAYHFGNDPKSEPNKGRKPSGTEGYA